jgi:hypothetical protein
VLQSAAVRQAPSPAERPVNINSAVDKAYENSSFAEILKAPVSALQGLSDGDATKLKDALNIKTVGDLATNKYFLRAMAIAQLANSEK